jgi:hypothetical protein
VNYQFPDREAALRFLRARGFAPALKAWRNGDWRAALSGALVVIWREEPA